MHKVVLSLVLIIPTLFSTPPLFEKKISTLLYLNDVKQALLFSKKAMILFPQNLMLSKQCIECYARNGETSEAIRLLKKIYTNRIQDQCYNSLVAVICKSVLAQSVPLSPIEQYANFLIIDNQDNDSVEKVCKGLTSDNLFNKLQSIKQSKQFPDYRVKKILVEIFLKEDRFFLIEALLEAFVGLEVGEAVPAILEKIRQYTYTVEQKMLFIRALVHLNCKDEAIQILNEQDEGYRDCFLLSMLEKSIDIPSKESIEAFLNSDNVSVQFNALALLAQYHCNGKLKQVHKDHPYLQMVLMWLKALNGDNTEAENLFIFSKHQFSEFRYFSAHLLSKLEPKLVKIYGTRLLQSNDQLLQVIGAQCLIENQLQTETCYEVISQFLLSDETLLHRRSLFHPLFSHISVDKTNISSHGEMEDLTIRWELYLVLHRSKHVNIGEVLNRFISKYKSEHAKLMVFSYLLEHPDIKIERGPYQVLHQAYQDHIAGDDKRAFNTLFNNYSSMKAFEKNLVIQMMSFICHPLAVNFLIKRLEDPFISIKIQSASSLIKNIKR